MVSASVWIACLNFDAKGLPTPPLANKDIFAMMKTATRGDPLPMPDSSESQRIATLYEQLRIRLLDLSKKNRMLNYNLGARSKRHLQILDEVLEEVYKKLTTEERSLRILPLDDPEDTPPEERTEDFITELERARASDIEYLMKLEALESQGRDDEASIAKLDRELREKILSAFRLASKAEKDRNQPSRTCAVCRNRPESRTSAESIKTSPS